MSREFDDYIANKAAYDRATNTIVRLVEDLRQFAEPILDDWATCYVEVSGQPTPMDMINGRQKVDGSKLPSVADLRNALLTQFNAQKEASQAWEALSPQEKAELKTPPWLQKSR